MRFELRDKTKDNDTEVVTLYIELDDENVPTLYADCGNDEGIVLAELHPDGLKLWDCEGCFNNTQFIKTAFKGGFLKVSKN